jgi:E2/UBC family protein E/multiubiquitin
MEGTHMQHTDNIEVIIVEMVELEEHARKHGCEAPHAKHYAFRVDKQRVVVSTPTITGIQILAEVGKAPEGYKLYQHKRGHQPVQIAPHQTVNLREPGVERFTTMPKDTTEGLEGCPLRRDFRLPRADEEYLDSVGLAWETVLDQRTRWLVIRDWKLPLGYNHSISNLALLIPDNYSDSQIDMVYFEKPLARTDGGSIGALSTQTIRGTVWQRWSRHRTPQNPWRIGVDDVSTHLSLVDDWLGREFLKAA